MYGPYRSKSGFEGFMGLLNTGLMSIFMVVDVAAAWSFSSFTLVNMRFCYQRSKERYIRRRMQLKDEKDEYPKGSHTHMQRRHFLNERLSWKVNPFLERNQKITIQTKQCHVTICLPRHLSLKALQMRSKWRKTRFLKGYFFSLLIFHLQLHVGKFDKLSTRMLLIRCFKAQLNTDNV